MIRKRWLAALSSLNALFISAVALAQQGGGGTDVNVDVGGGGGSAWYGQWYVWAILVGVFLVIVIALTNRGSRQT